MCAPTTTCMNMKFQERGRGTMQLEQNGIRAMVSWFPRMIPSTPTQTIFWQAGWDLSHCSPIICFWDGETSSLAVFGVQVGLNISSDPQSRNSSIFFWLSTHEYGSRLLKSIDPLPFLGYTATRPKLAVYVRTTAPPTGVVSKKSHRTWQFCMRGTWNIHGTNELLI